VTALHEAEEARKASEAQLRQILTRADCLLWQAHAVENAAGVIDWSLYIPQSSLYRELFGDDPSEHPNLMWSELNVPDLAEMNARSTAAMRSGAPGYEQEFCALRQGRSYWLHEQVSITAVGPGKWNLVGIITNVTAQHEAEEARKASEAQLRQILTRADCLLWQANVRREEGGVRWRNFTMPGSVLCQRLFGVNAPTTGTGLWLPEDTPDLAEMNRRSTEAVLSGAPGYEQEFSVLRSDRTLWLHEQVSIAPVGPDEWNLVGVLMDVTARREAEEARKESEARLRQILERVDCVLWYARVTDTDGRVEWQFDLPASGLQRRLFGGEGALKTRDLYANLTVPELPEMHARSAAALRGGAPGYEQEFRIVKPDRTHWIHERVSIKPQAPGEWWLFGVMIDVSALKEAEQVIRASEARYRDLFESAAEGVFQSTPDGHFISVNPSLARILGCATPSEFLAWPEAKAESLYVKPGRRAEFFVALGARDSVTDFESEVRCRDGTTKWISENVRAVRDAEGRLLHLQGFLSDVTERRKALEALRESEARYRALFENIPIAILELDFRDVGRRLQELHAAGVQDLSAHLADHPEELAVLKEQVRVAAVNDTAVRLYHTGSKEPFQGGLSRLFAADVLRVLQLFLESIWQGRNSGEAEVATEDFAGGRHYTYLRWWMPEPSERLKAGYAVVAAVDLSELKRAEAALAAEKERLAVTLRAMTEGVITADTQGVVQFMNRAAAELTRQEPAGVVGRHMAEVCALKDTRSGQSVTLPIARVLAEGALVDLPPHTSLVGRDGATCLVEGCCVPVRDVDSELVGMVLVLRDVTVRQRFEEELQRASRLESIGILAGGIAHDFNNILTAIMGNITLALLDGEALTKVERYLRDAERATLRARDLTQQLLTFAKGGDPVRTAVLLPQIITEVAQFALHGSRVKCEFDLPAGLWLADADKGQLGQVVQNLVINATQAMPEGGCIRIGARNEAVTVDSRRPLAPGDYVHISVADTGTGIKAEHLAKIFDPYFTTKQQGSGLGLTTVYSIIRKHNGHIEVESELGRGSTFHLWLPVRREEQLDLPEDRGDVMKPLQGRVLFMDDEEPIVQMATMLLRRLGFEVEQARDGSETVQKFAAAHGAGRSFDLVVMDLTVPGGMGGREAIDELRRIDPGVKAIVSSGYSSDPVLANYRAYGFSGMVAKPYKIDDFTRVLREVMRQSRPPIPGTLPGGPQRK
jgi:PAS domain S-box-containing protein